MIGTSSFFILSEESRKKFTPSSLISCNVSHMYSRQNFKLFLILLVGITLKQYNTTCCFRNQQETTLNPLAFINPPQTTTPSPAEQQAIEEQRRFQEEIANKGLREQEQRSLGLPQPPTTRPTTTTSTSTQNPLDPFLFQIDPFGNTEPEAGLEQSTENIFFNDGRVPQPATPQSILPQFQPVLSQVPQSHSYSYSRIFRSLNRKSRSIDRQQLSVNLLPSTVAPQQFYYSEKRQTTPRTEYGSIGSWLISHFSQQLQQSIASLAQTTASSHSPRPVKSYPTQPNYRRPSYTEKPYLYTTTGHRPTTPQFWQRHPESGFRPTAPQPWRGHPSSTELPVTSSPRPFQYSGTDNHEVPSYGNIPLRFQIPQYPQAETEPSVRHEAANYIPSGVIQTTSVPQVASFKPLPAAYMVQPHLPLLPQSAPTYSPYLTSTPASTDDYTKPVRVKSVQILTSSPSPFDSLPLKPQNEEEVYQAYRQIFAADHQSLRPTESAVQSSTQSSEENTSVTSLFKSKLNEFKSFHPSQVAALENAQSNFQQPNQFLDQLQQQPDTNSNQFRSSTSANSADLVDLTSGSGNDASKTAIFIRVPSEEPTSTVGYVFDKAISAKTLQKKENLTGHKKNNRSAQVIKSSLVYRTPPGKRATVSREELLQNNQVNNLEAETPIKWLLGNTGPVTTKRPLVNALLNFIQKQSPQ